MYNLIFLHFFFLFFSYGCSKPFLRVLDKRLIPLIKPRAKVISVSNPGRSFSAPDLSRYTSCFNILVVFRSFAFSESFDNAFSCYWLRIEQDFLDNVRDVTCIISKCLLFILLFLRLELATVLKARLGVENLNSTKRKTPRNISVINSTHYFLGIFLG